jgi:uncharacterized protein (TIGR02646 family)
VIPVAPQSEPAEFDERVRQRGKAWIDVNNLNRSLPLPKGWKYPNNPAYWAKQEDGYSSLQQLYEAYQKVCAYTGLRISLGAKSVDHFIPKSKSVGDAFEWSNYRLACRIINGLKKDFTQVLDPFSLESETFFLVLETGKIYVNPAIANPEIAQKTIEILGLDCEELREERAEHYKDFQDQEITASHLQKYAPFVYLEAQRQGQL